MSPFIRTIAFTITAGLLGAASQPAHAANFVVTTNADSGVGSLRWALQQAALTPLSMDTITFNLPANALTISPLTTLPKFFAVLDSDPTVLHLAWQLRQHRAELKVDLKALKGKVMLSDGAGTERSFALTVEGQQAQEA